MDSVLVWLQSAPSGAITVLTASLGAIVAVSVVVLTQWILGRRARTDLLTKKLEELYLLLNQASSENLDRFEIVVALAHVSLPSAYGERKEVSKSAYALDLHKKILMYVRLYFSNLSEAHQTMFKLNSDINSIIHRLTNEQRPSEQEVKKAFGGYGDSLRNMEQEIIKNRAVLVRDHVLPKRYTRVT